MKCALAAGLEGDNLQIAKVACWFVKQRETCTGCEDNPFALPSGDGKGGTSVPAEERTTGSTGSEPCGRTGPGVRIPPMKPTLETPEGKKKKGQLKLD